MRKKLKPLKVKWGWVNTPDAEARLQAAFNILLNKLEESDEEGTGSSITEKMAENPNGQLPLF